MGFSGKRLPQVETEGKSVEKFRAASALPYSYSCVNAFSPSAVDGFLQFGSCGKLRNFLGRNF
jgi:hypothetical protein